MPAEITEVVDAKTLGFNRRTEFFGGEIAFKRIDTITLEVLAHNVSTKNSVISEISDLFDLRDGRDWSYLRINGQIYDNAKLVGFSLPQETFTQTATCNLTFEIHNYADNLTNLSDVYYKDYKAAFQNKPFISEISESVNFEIGENSISYSKNINIKFNESFEITGSQNGPVQIAQSFAKSIFDEDADNSYTHLKIVGTEQNMFEILNSGYRKIRSESLNVISNSCSFTESIQATNIIDPNGIGYSHSATQSISIDKIGVATVTESGEVKGLKVPILTSANDGYDAEILLARTRIENLFNRLSSCGNLNEDNNNQILFMSESKTINEDEGIISYSVTADNDKTKENSNQGVFYQNETTISTTNGYKEVSSNGVIVGISIKKYDGNLSGLNRYPKYIQAKTFFTSNIAGIITQVGSTVAGLSPNPISRQETHSPLKGELTYELSYSSRPEFQSNGGGGDIFKSITSSEDTSTPTEKANEFGIINERYIVQRQLGSTQGSNSASVNIRGYRESPSENNVSFVRDKLLSEATSKVSSLITDKDHLSSAEYSFSFQNDVNLNLSASYITEIEELI